jgi:hypothetical protein
MRIVSILLFLLSILNVSAQQADTMAFQQDSFISIRKKTDSTAQCRFLIRYPHFNGRSPLDSSINFIIKNWVTGDTMSGDTIRTSSLQAAADSFFHEWEITNSEFSNAEWTSFNYELNVSVLHQNKNYITLDISSFSYLGGEQAIEITSLFAYEKATGQAIFSWKELFTDTASVLKIAEQQFRKDKGIAISKSVSEEWFEGSSFRLTDNVGFTKTGVLFFYNAYEIASYLNEQNRLEIPYSKIEPYLKKQAR